jgi:hypothetical protein
MLFTSFETAPGLHSIESSHRILYTVKPGYFLDPNETQVLGADMLSHELRHQGWLLSSLDDTKRWLVEGVGGKA